MEEKKGSNKVLIIVGVVVALILLCCFACGAFFYLFGTVKDANGNCTYKGPLYAGTECGVFPTTTTAPGYNY
jgi:hypothetical protein